MRALVFSSAPVLLLGLSVLTVAAVAACLTDPPPDLPIDSEPPLIDHLSVFPPGGPPLTSLPAFTVPVFLVDPTQACQWSVYDQYHEYFTCEQCVTSAIQDGIIKIDFNLSGALFDPTLCHDITFIVGGVFSDSQCEVGGSDVATWEYAPPFAACSSYDASALGDGAFPDASSDALPLVLDSGGHP